MVVPQEIREIDISRPSSKLSFLRFSSYALFLASIEIATLVARNAFQIGKTPTSVYVVLFFSLGFALVAWINIGKLAPWRWNLYLIVFAPLVLYCGVGFALLSFIFIQYRGAPPTIQFGSLSVYRILLT